MCGRAACSTHSLDEQYLFRVVGFFELDFHNFVFLGLNPASHEGGFDRKFTVAAVN